MRRIGSGITAMAIRVRYVGLAMGVIVLGSAPECAASEDRYSVIAVSTACGGEWKDDLIHAASGDTITWVLVNNCNAAINIEVHTFAKRHGKGHNGSNNKDSPFDRAAGSLFAVTVPGNKIDKRGPFKVHGHNDNKTWYAYAVKIGTTDWDPEILIER